MVYKQAPLKTKTHRRPLPLLLTVAAVALLLVVGILELTNVTHLFHARPVAKIATITATTEPTKDAPKPTTNDPGTPAPTNPVGSDNKGNGDVPAPTPAPNGAAPDVPSGTFLSNHNPSLSGNPYPSSVQSVCNTTPGAKCSIRFTKGDLVRTLPEQTTNGDGNAFWTWDVKQAAFTEGTWDVTVTATLNGKSTTAQDTLTVGS